MYRNLRIHPNKRDILQHQTGITTTSRRIAVRETSVSLCNHRCPIKPSPSWNSSNLVQRATKGSIIMALLSKIFQLLKTQSKQHGKCTQRNIFCILEILILYQIWTVITFFYYLIKLNLTVSTNADSLKLYFTPCAEKYFLNLVNLNSIPNLEK